MRAWTTTATERMLRTHTKGTPDRTLKDDDLIKRGKIPFIDLEDMGKTGIA